MKKRDMIISGVIFIASLAVYLFTITPTLPFWDCGEFISCSYTLGVPHPPGTPLMILIGNMFVRIFFFIKEVALRVNLFSAISSAFAGVVLFWILLKVFSRMNPNPEKSETAVNYISSVLAVLSASFFYSFWQSSVEAEVYNPALLMILLVIYLSLIWWDKLEQSNDDRFVMLVIYITLLSIGIHMLPLLALPGAIIFFILIAWKKYFDLSVSLISFAIFFAFLYMAMTKEVFALVFIGIFLAVFSIVLIDYMSGKRGLNYRKVFTYLGIYVLLVVVSVSTYAVLYLRAQHNPYINIAAPVTLRELWDVFNRKQYGPMMLLPRKTDYGIGTLPATVEQFKLFFRYYSWQFGSFMRGEIVHPSALQRIIPMLIMAIVSSTGIYGIYLHFKNEKKSFALIFTTFLLLSAGLVIYLNLKYSPSDINPLHVEKEVRERDYFYSGSYYLFMFFFAMGLRDILLSFKRRKGTEKSFPLSPAQIGVTALALLLPFIILFSNINSNVNRRNNWIADEYAKNMLDTPRDNSIMFTNGDNDTYPLWFEQTVKNYRTLDRKAGKGVMVCNLSLLNTNWYVKQMKSFGVPISFSDNEIDLLTPVRISRDEVLYIRDLVIRNIICTTSGIKCTRDILYATSDEFRDKVMSNYKADSINVYFSVTVSESARIGFKKNSVLEGLAYRIVNSDSMKDFPMNIDLETTRKNINDVYSYKYILDNKIVKDDNIDRIMTNYAAGYLQMGIYYASIDSLQNAVDYLQEGKKFYVYDRGAVSVQIARFLVELGKYEEAEKEMEYAINAEKTEDRKVAYLAFLSDIYVKTGRYEEALKMYDEIEGKYPNEGISFAGKLRIYKGMGNTQQYDSIKTMLMMNPDKLGSAIGFLYMQREDKAVLLDLLDIWEKLKPGDSQVADIRKEIKSWKE